MPISPRAEALHLMQNGQEVVPPVMPDYEPSSPEAFAFLESIKVPHYVSVAQAIDLLFDQATRNRSDEPPYGLSEFSSPYVQHTGWQKLAADFRATFMEARDEIEDTDAYRNAEEFARIIGTLDPERHINFFWQIDGGVNTGVGSTLTLLRNAPQIIRHHEPDYSQPTVSAIMRHPQSTVLLRRLSKTSINQMMAAQSALVGEYEHHSWSNIDQVPDPRRFKLHSHANGTKSLDYADFSGLTIPAGYTPHHTVAPVETTTLVSDIPAHQSKVIGCPITLLQQRLAELLGWGLDIVEAKQLWDENWPPAAATAKAPALSQPS